MGIGDDIVERSIQIQTVHSFFYSVLMTLEIIQPGGPAFLDRYEQFKDEALAYFNSGVLGSADVERLFRSTAADFSLPQHIARPTSTSNASRSNGFFRML